MSEANTITSLDQESGTRSTSEETATTSVVGDKDVQFSKHANFRIGKIVYDLTFSESKLSWMKHSDSSGTSVCVPVEEIVNVHHIHGVRSKEGTGQVEGFTVRYVNHSKKHVLKREFVQFLELDGDQQKSQKWTEMIQEAVGKVKERPHKLLVLINPASGGRNGKKIYETTAAGVFKEAQIDTDVIITQRAHHCEEILSAYDVTNIDGVVLVGGDGMYHEAVNGLQHRLMKEAGDENDPSTSPKPVPLTIGLIPAGTGNAIAVGCYGTSDPETAALAIMIGRTKMKNIITVHSGGKLVGYSGLMVGYGFWADMVHNAENRRHLGVFRYPVTMLDNALIKPQRQMDLTIDYLPPMLSNVKKPDCEAVSPEEQNKNQSAEGKESKEAGSEPMKIAVTNSSDGRTESEGQQNTPDDQAIAKNDNTQTSEIANSSGTKWESRQGVYTGGCVTIGSLRVESDKSVPQEDCTRLLLNKPSGRIQSLTFMVKLMMQDKALESPLVEHMLVKEYKIKLNKTSEPESDNYKKEHMIVLDGEIFPLEQPEFHARLHPKLVRLFCSTSEDWCGEPA